MAARLLVPLCFVPSNPSTPKKDKYIVYPALAYKKLNNNITPTIEMQADELLDEWFP